MKDVITFINYWLSFLRASSFCLQAVRCCYAAIKLPLMLLGKSGKLGQIDFGIARVYALFQAAPDWLRVGWLYGWFCRERDGSLFPLPGGKIFGTHWHTPRYAVSPEQEGRKGKARKQSYSYRVSVRSDVLFPDATFAIFFFESEWFVFVFLFVIWMIQTLFWPDLMMMPIDWLAMPARK